MKQSSLGQKQKDLEEYQLLANQERFPALIEAIQGLRQVLNKLRQHHFIGVPAFRRLRINSTRFCQYYRDYGTKEYYYSHINLSGRWLQERGFEKDGYYYIIRLNGLLILCPANYPTHREANAAMETELTFGPSTSKLEEGRLL